MKLHFMQSGRIRTWRHLLVRRAAEGVRFTVPIPFYLIEHEKGMVLFDCGQIPPESEPPPEANYITEMTREDIAVNVLKARGFDPQKLCRIIISHSHGDHIDGLQALPDVPCCIQRREPGGFLEKYADRQWYLLDGEYDLFGDGRIILLPTYGHTAGHQSLLLTLDDGQKLLLAVDAAYTGEALEQYPVTEAEKEEPYWQTIARLQEFRRQGVRVIPGHDPSCWEQLMQEFY